ncbi:hypothetical protein JX266_006270 [Neoarthrinium moseri]|nr:hypothetical protein JX266_006270 [Neoarthrinium moseri]
MRLLNTSTFELKEFNDGAVPPYAILSHTRRKAFSKIQDTCKLALAQGYKHAWIDTCCIDKLSSAELTEAINSMFNWYRESAICYVYLTDLAKTESFDEKLSGCRWSSRGWTLQELIAPPKLEFYDAQWKYRGTKAEFSTLLSEATGVNEGILTGTQDLADVPVGRRMSWASTRQTTRVEDMAYSLLGIFGVNMALIYGERERSFVRLQEEIIKMTNDLSIFAWSRPTLPSEQAVVVCTGLLASSPSEFHTCRNLVVTESIFLGEIGITNNGIKLPEALLAVAPLEIDRGGPAISSYRHYMLPLYHRPGGMDTPYSTPMRIHPTRHCISDSPFWYYDTSILYDTIAIRLRQIGPRLFIRGSPEASSSVPRDSLYVHDAAESFHVIRGPGTYSNFPYGTGQIPMHIPRPLIRRMFTVYVTFSPKVFPRCSPIASPRDAWDLANWRFHLQQEPRIICSLNFDLGSNSEESQMCVTYYQVDEQVNYGLQIGRKPHPFKPLNQSVRIPSAAGEVISVKVICQYWPGNNWNPPGWELQISQD